MAYAVRHDIVRSMDTLGTAIEAAPTHFCAQLKYGELHYRLRALDSAESETLKAADLAENEFDGFQRRLDRNRSRRALAASRAG